MTLTDAVAAYRQERDAYGKAALVASDARRGGFTPAARKANDAARVARQAWEHARDELVIAALIHHCEAP